MKRISLVLILALASAAGSAPAVAQKQPAATPTPQGKRPPQAKTTAEFKDYNAAYAITGGSEMEAAADTFAKKYPDSELRQYLYSKAMHEYQTENNPAKMLVMGEKILSLDPDDPIALVLTATVLSDQLSDGDPNRAQILAEIKKNAGRALQTVDTSLAPPAGATPDQIAAYKDTLRSMAYSALGIMNLKTGDDAAAEKDLHTAADLNKTQPDAYIWYHLALAQDHQKKYTDALASVEQALRYIGSNADLGKLANGERDRLRQLTGGTTAPAPGSPNPAPPPH
jgi:tetratricopeptide (TPR) repeat protein